MSLGLGELIILLLIAFLVIGPEDLPKAARRMGKFFREAKGLYSEVQNTLKEDCGVTDDLKLIHSEIQKSYTANQKK